MTIYDLIFWARGPCCCSKHSVCAVGGVCKIPHQFQWVTLTCTHSFFVPRHVRAVVAVQSLVVIARVGLIAHLADLSGAGFAAVAPVHEEAHPQRARRGDAGTLAGPLAVLRAVVRFWHRGCDGRDVCGRRHRSGILGEGLERGKQKAGFSPGGCFLWRTVVINHNQTSTIITQKCHLSDVLNTFHTSSFQSSVT